MAISVIFKFHLYVRKKPVPVAVRSKHRSAAARLLRLWVRILPRAWMFVCCECCVLSGRGLCDGLITRPEESYRLWCVIVCDLETSSRMRRPWPTLGCSAIWKKKMLEINMTSHDWTFRLSWSDCKWVGPVPFLFSFFLFLVYMCWHSLLLSCHHYSSTFHISLS